MTDTAKDMPVLKPGDAAKALAWFNGILNAMEMLWLPKGHSRQDMPEVKTIRAALDNLSRPQAPAEGEVAEAVQWATHEIMTSRKKADDARYPAHIQKISLVYAQRLDALLQAATRSSQTGAEGLVKALEGIVSKCSCKGTGKTVKTRPCTMCHDSTWDHECNDEDYEVNCGDKLCHEIRDIIAAHRKQTGMTEANNEKREG